MISAIERREMRMQKLPVFLLCLLIGLLFVSGQSISGETQKEICVPLKMLLLKPPATVEARRPLVEFPHSKHLLLYSCKTCHHKWEGEEQISSCMASSCHNLTKSPEGARRKGRTWLDFSEEQVKYYRNAYHKQCIVCHKQINLRNIAALEEAKGEQKPELEPTGPTKCVKCHVK